jgi:O-antigen/teichoic acid export membrane protein
VASLVVVAGGLAMFGWATGRFTPPLLLIAVGIGIVVLAWQQLGAELIRAQGDLRLASLFSGGQSGGPVSNLLFLAGLGAAALAAAQMSATLAVGTAVASLCLTCPLVYFGLWRTHRRLPVVLDDGSPLSAAQRHELLTVGGFLLVNQLLAFATQQLDIWLAGGLLTQEALGLYGAAKRSLLVSAMPVQMAMLTIVSTIPRLHAQSRRVELERVVRWATTAAAIPALVALGALTIFPGQILTVVLGGPYSGAEATLLVLALGHYVLVLSGNPQHVLTMTGRHRAVLAVNSVSAMVLVISGAMGAWLFGAPGLAAGSAASLALQNGVLWWLARRELGIWTHVGIVNRADSGDDATSRRPLVVSSEACSSERVATPEPASLSAACPP